MEVRGSEGGGFAVPSSDDGVVRRDVAVGGLA